MIMDKNNVGTSNLDPHQFVEIEFSYREIVNLLVCRQCKTGGRGVIRPNPKILGVPKML